MSMSQWKVPVTRIRTSPAGKDQYEEDIPGEPTPMDLPRALFDPGSSQEPVEAGASPVITKPTLYWRDEFPDVQSTDQILVAGSLFRVEGKPARWPKGLVVELRGVEAGG